MEQPIIATLGPWVTLAKDVLLGGAAVAAAVFAYLGLSAWRTELKGQAEYRLAKDVLKSVYKVRDAFMHVRNPVIFSYEFPEEMRNYHGHLKHEDDYAGTAHVYMQRWKAMDEAFRELEEHHLDAQVEWGPEFQSVIVKLRACRGELLLAIQRMLERKKNPRDVPETTVEKRAEERSVLYHVGSDSEFDKFTPEIEEAIKDFERWLRPHITSRR